MVNSLLAGVPHLYLKLIARSTSMSMDLIIGSLVTFKITF
jgi:hypothetical protein